MVAPIERQTRVSHQLVGGEVSWLFSRQDRSDNVGGKKVQPHEARRIRHIWRGRRRTAGDEFDEFSPVSRGGEQEARHWRPSVRPISIGGS